MPPKKHKDVDLRTSGAVKRVLLEKLGTGTFFRASELIDAIHRENPAVSRSAIVKEVWRLAASGAVKLDAEMRVSGA
jgi:hypothetical protein